MSKLEREYMWQSNRISQRRQAIRLYRENPADLIITDLIMPEKKALKQSWNSRKISRMLKSLPFREAAGWSLIHIFN